MKWPALAKLWQLSSRRFRSESDYRHFQAFQARLLVEYLADQRVIIEGRILLDLGSGLAGYSQEFARAGAKVISADLIKSANSSEAPWSHVQANAVAIPLRKDSVDVVFCASLIEHVAEPADVLREIERVLKAGGVCYLSFPPFYSPLGGHEFSPFHYLGERLAIRLVQRDALLPDWVRRVYRPPRTTGAFSEMYQGWGLYKMTIAKFRKLLADTKLTCQDASTRFVPVNFANLPVLGEFLTWHAQFLLVKQHPD